MFEVDLGERVELNGFTRHGIERLSPSQINKFIECPSAYVAQYLLGHRFPSGAAAYRGRAVETGLHRALYGDDLSACIRAAEKQFEEEISEEIEKPTTIEEDVARDREYDAIPDMVTLAADELADFGMPDGKNDAPQRQVIANAKFDTYSIPIVGYVDFTFSDFDLVVDLKTTFACPQKMRASHVRQRIIYAAATGQTVKFLYVTPKKTIWLCDGDFDVEIKRLKTYIARMERFLNRPLDEIVETTPIDLESFYWKKAEHIAAEIYGL